METAAPEARLRSCGLRFLTQTINQVISQQMQMSGSDSLIRRANA